MGGFEMIGSIFQAEATKDAANKQADAIRDAQRTSQEAADKAQAEILDRMNPALANFRQEIYNSIDTLKNGETSIMDILQRSTGQANQLLSNAGADAMRSIMGSRASSQGIPRQQFTQAYSTGGPQAVQQLTGGRVSVPGGTAAPVPVGQGISPQQPGTLAQAAGTTTAGLPAGMDARAEYNRIMAEQAPADLGGGYRPVLDEMGRPVMETLGRVGGIGGGAVRAPKMEEYTSDQAIADWQKERDARAQEALRGYWSPEMRGAEQFGQIGLPGVAGMDQVDTSGTGFYASQGKLEQGLAGGLQALARGTTAARGDIIGGRESALSAVEQARESGLAAYQPYSEAGRAAIQQEAALSGAMGAEAQQEAINAFIESPGQKYLREQQEKALLRSAAATGGLGGGRVLSALQEQAMGRAATQQQQQLENLRSIAGRGQQVAGAEAGLYTGAGSQIANIQQQAAANLSNLAQQLGVREADLMQMSAQQQAALAERTGLNIANIQQTIQTAQAANQLGLGGALAQQRGSTLADIAGLQSGLASTELTGQQNISQILANLATQTGTNLAGLQVAGGAAQAAGAAGLGNIYAQMGQNLGQTANYWAENRPWEQWGGSTYGGYGGQPATATPTTGSTFTPTGGTQSPTMTSGVY